MLGTRVAPQLLFFTFTAENTLKAWTIPTGKGLNLSVLDLVLDGVPPQLGDLNNKIRFATYPACCEHIYKRRPEHSKLDEKKKG
eukprot:917476-Pyramimonas_sp.AAC.1